MYLQSRLVRLGKCYDLTAVTVVTEWSDQVKHTFLGSLTIPLSWPEMFGSHASSSPARDFPSITWLTLRLREFTLRIPSSPWGGTSSAGSHLASSTSWWEGRKTDMLAVRTCGHTLLARRWILPLSSWWSPWVLHCWRSLSCQVQCQTEKERGWLFNNRWNTRTCTLKVILSQTQKHGLCVTLFTISLFAFY